MIFPKFPLHARWRASHLFYFKKKLCGALIAMSSCAFFFLPAHAQGYVPPPEASLFFTPQEAREAERLARQSAPAGQGEIQLGAVIYYGPNDWAFWLQNEKWTPTTLREDMQVLEVNADEVRLVWRGGGGSQEVTLRPYQSFKVPAKKYTKR